MHGGTSSPSILKAAMPMQPERCISLLLQHELQTFRCVHFEPHWLKMAPTITRSIQMEWRG